jgi:hypothetical protein
MALSNLVTYSNFVGELAIDLTKDDNQTHLDYTITQWQREILIRLLGVGLYKDFYDNDAATKYATLKNGETNGIYLNGEDYYEFRGVTEMLKYFIYFYYNRYNQSSNTELGERKTVGGNLQAGDSLRLKMVRAWNKGIDMYNQTIVYIYFKNESEETYPDFLPKKLDKLTVL